eukprot:4362886-Pyramimonas_sp.AAC.1
MKWGALNGPELPSLTCEGRRSGRGGGRGWSCHSPWRPLRRSLCPPPPQTTRGAGPGSPPARGRNERNSTSFYGSSCANNGKDALKKKITLPLRAGGR